MELIRARVTPASLSSKRRTTAEQGSCASATAQWRALRSFRRRGGLRRVAAQGGEGPFEERRHQCSPTWRISGWPPLTRGHRQVHEQAAGGRARKCKAGWTGWLAAALAPRWMAAYPATLVARVAARAALAGSLSGRVAPPPSSPAALAGRFAVLSSTPSSLRPACWHAGMRANAAVS